MLVETLGKSKDNYYNLTKISRPHADPGVRCARYIHCVLLSPSAAPPYLCFLLANPEREIGHGWTSDWANQRSQVLLCRFRLRSSTVVTINRSGRFLFLAPNNRRKPTLKRLGLNSPGSLSFEVHKKP